MHSLTNLLERIMPDGLEKHDGTASTGDRTITNLRLTDEINAFVEEEQELVALPSRHMTS